MNEYKIVRICPENLNDFLTLFNIVHKEKIELSFFQKKFDTQFTGISYVGFIAYDKNNIPCSYYGVLPCILSLNNQRIIGAQSGDTVTHPEHRKRGLFYMLARKTIELCKELEIEFLFGIPNGNSFPGLLKLNWKHEGDMIYTLIQIRPNFLIKVLRRINKNLFRKKVNSILSKYASPSLSKYNFKNSEDFYQPKDQKLLNYKLKVNRYIIFLPEGECIFRVTDFEFIIGDFLIYESKSKDVYWNKLSSLAAKIGADKISFNCTQNIKYLYSFPKNSIVEKGLPILTLNLLMKQNLPQISLTGFDYDTF